MGDEGRGAANETATGLPDASAPLLGVLSSLGVSSHPGERLARHTSFKIGGPAAVFVEPAREADAVAAVAAAAAGHVPVLVVGLGSNLLVSDRGFAGLVVSLARACRAVAVEGDRLRAGAGVSLAKAAHVAESHGLTGLEYAVSIPGTVGGAVVMNAGAHGRATADGVQEVRVFDPRQGVMTLQRDDLGYAYRYSRAQTEPWVVLEALFQLRPGPVERIRDTMRGHMEHRRRTQPVGEKNAGSMFKNPPGAFAAALIEAVGAKGWRCGGAGVSSLHANFIANDGTATARDVLDLMRRVRSAVRDRFGILLRPEVRWVGPSEGEDGTTWDDLWLKADDG